MTFHIRFSDSRELKDALAPHNSFASKLHLGSSPLTKFTTKGHSVILTSFSQKGSYIDNFIAEVEYCLIEGEGEAVIPIDKLFKIATKLPQGKEVEMWTEVDENLDLEDDNSITGELKIKCGKASFKLPLFNSDLYQPISFNEEKIVCQIDIVSNKLLECLKKVGRFAPTSVNFATFNSFYFNYVNEAIDVVATNGKSINVCELIARVRTSDPENSKAIVPTESMKKVETALSNLQYEGVVAIQVTDKRIKFVAGEYSFILNLLNGTYPDYKSLTPTEFNNHFNVNPMVVKDVVERSVIFDEVEGVHAVLLKKTDEGLLLANQAINKQGFEDTLDVDLTNCEDFSRSYNAKYILDTLSVQNGTDCRVDILKDGAFFIKSRTKEGMLMQCMVMPLRWS